ncbi:hypothetical protein [Paenibacillus mendelii]|uniref:DUF2759 domain-containing protein n=1 Tax=Paenibacillus mendelii TaxID=206163 RepID=A0ABV6J5B6_9BACL|nr:hypothetical protein [Paenibacillus mendelii]MCQ6561725.1 hypothetical protein [Paenibacillus mendelii]
MTGFIIFFMTSFGLAIFFMVRMKKHAKEISIFVTLALIGFTVWIAIFMDKTINPYRWIARVIDITGL